MDKRLAASLDDARRQHEAADRARSSRTRMKHAHDHDGSSFNAKFMAQRAEKSVGKALVRAEAHLAHHRETIVAAGQRERGRDLILPHELAANAHVAHIAGLTIGRADRVRIAGPNGAGKSTLLHALLDGLRLPRSRVLFVPQVVAEDDVRHARAALEQMSVDDRSHALAIVAALGVSPPSVRASPSPSSGEARKLLIALGLARRVSAVFLDEPTNHLDLPAIERLEALLATFAGALVLVTHDDVLAARLTTSVVDLGNPSTLAVSLVR